MTGSEQDLTGKVIRHRLGRTGRVLQDTGGHTVLVRWTDGSLAESGGTDGWYSRHALAETAD